ncbi:MAG TPA: hypothetical protein VK850_14525 [Candidatus Binatia bacterium]|nr:hypothetical protein [Candidatus Binatia bacterium]
MQLKQIIVRPSDNEVIVQFTDNVGRVGSLSYDPTNDATATAFIDQAKTRLPTEQNRPDRTDIEQEIEELEYRLAQLKESIGQP